MTLFLLLTIRAPRVRWSSPRPLTRTPATTAAPPAAGTPPQWWFTWWTVSVFIRFFITTKLVRPAQHSALLITSSSNSLNSRWILLPPPRSQIVWIFPDFDLPPAEVRPKEKCWLKSVLINFFVFVSTFLIFLSDGEVCWSVWQDCSDSRMHWKSSDLTTSLLFQEKTREQVNVVCQVKEQKCGVKAKYFLSYFHCFAASSRLEQKIALMANKSNLTLNMNWIFMVLKIGSK